MTEKKIYPVIISLIVSIGGLLLGMSATIGGALEFFKLQFNLSPSQEGLSVAAAMYGTFIGNFFVGNITDAIGRRKALILAAVLFSFMTLGSGLSPNYEMLILTRFIGGFGIGLSLLAAPMYIAEFAPSSRRGFLVSFNQLNIGIGFLLAALSNSIIDRVFVDPDVKWRMMLAIGTIFPILYIIGLIFVPESPRWLITKGKFDEAKKIMVKVGGEAYAENEIKEIRASIKADQEASGSTEALSYGEKWKIMFSKPMTRIVIIAFSIMMFQMLSGLNNVFFFGPKIFRMAGADGFMSPFMKANIIGIVMVIMTVVAMLVIDKLGRKPLLYIGVSLIAGASLLIGYAFNNAEYKVDETDIANIEQSIIHNAVKTKARALNSSHYGIDKISIEYGQALLYRKGEKITNVSMHEPEILDAQNDATVIKAMLSTIQDKTFTKELEFFGTVKSLFNENKANIKNTSYASIKDQLLDASIHVNSIWVLVGIILIVVGFSISLGPIAWAMLSEIFPAKIRGLGISIAGMLNGLTSAAVAQLFPIELEYLGSAWTFFIFAGFMILCLFFIFKWYPETKGKSLEEIERELIIK